MKDLTRKKYTQEYENNGNGVFQQLYKHLNTHNRTREDAPTRRALSFCLFIRKGKRNNKDKPRKRTKKDNKSKEGQRREGRTKSVQRDKNKREEVKNRSKHATSL